MNGPITFMVRNGVAANLLMIFLVVAGLASLLTIKQMVFPDFSLEQVEVRVEYPGALPEEVEQSIVKRVEDQIEGIDGIREVRATAAEGVGVVIVEFNRGTDIQQKLDEIKAEVDRITSFPEDAEEPQVSERTNRSRVVEIAIHGDVPDQALKTIADQLKTDLSQLPEISFVETRGVRPSEISIEVPSATLRAYGLSLTDVSRIVRENSLDLPAGEIETEGNEILVRTTGRALTGDEYASLVVIAAPGGAVVRLGDIATIRDGFEDTDSEIIFNGQPSVYVQVYRIGEERVLEVVGAAEAFVETELRPRLPEGIEATIWRNDAAEFQSRLSLLARNGLIGLCLVVVLLSLFLNLRLAFWVSVGIFVSFVGTIGVLSLLDASLNQISLFGFILAIGIVVDDAIVVGENVYSEMAKGRPPEQAAILGTRRIARPVLFAVLTTMVVFVPLLFLPGTLGAFLGPIPTVVIAVLALSLVEALLILPRHLSHAAPQSGGIGGFITAPIVRVQNIVSRGLDRFVDGPLTSAVRFAIIHPGIVIATAISMSLACFGLLSSGLVTFGFAPRVEASYVNVSLELAPGSTSQQTRIAGEKVLDAGVRALEDVERRYGLEKGSMLAQTYISVGTGSGVGGGGPGGGAISLPQASEATMIIELVSDEQRPFPTREFEARWRERVPELPGIRKLTLSSSLIEIGSPVQVELSSVDNDVLDSGVAALEEELRRLEGIFDVTNDQQRGRRQISLSLRPIARSYGLTLESVARQIRAAFFGAEALRVQRDQDEVRVYVRLPREERDDLGDIRAFRIATQDGGFVPLEEVARIKVDVGPSAINRRDGLGIVTVSADLDPDVTSAQDANTYLVEEFLPGLVDRNPGLSYRLAGEQAEQGETLGVLLRNFLLAMFGIYAVMGVAFRSYTQPLIVLAAIPFGAAGAILGHFLLDTTMTVISIYGIVGLSGVIINGSLVLIDFINEQLEKGANAAQAVLDASKSRFRPILLTSLTTFFGISPLLFEPGVQAQFLVPLAISLGFGVLFGTPIFMLLVPAIVAWSLGATRSGIRPV